MVRLSVGYPDHDAQMALLRDRLSENPLDAVEQVLTRKELLTMQADVRAVPDPATRCSITSPG